MVLNHYLQWILLYIYTHIVLLLVHCLWFHSASMIERLIFLLLMTYPHIPRQPQSIWGPGTVVVSPGKKVGRGYVGYPNGHGNHGNRGNHGRGILEYNPLQHLPTFFVSSQVTKTTMAG